MKLYYITRSYPDSNTGGGGIIRKGTIDHLVQYGYDVWIIAPSYNGKLHIDKEKKHILLPHLGHFKTCAVLESIGIFDDYLEWWAFNAYVYLRKIIKKDDLLLATSGGELGPTILAYKLKKYLGCKYMINFHDPLNFTTVNGTFLRYYKTFVKHVVRDSAEEKYLLEASAIITSSEVYRNILMNKYPKLRIFNNHFGYVSERTLAKTYSDSPKINIVYGGAMGVLQSPELLARAAIGLDNINVYYVGEWKKNSNLSRFRNEKNVILVDSMPNDSYIEFLLQTADLCFVSLLGPTADLCVPSKIYENINLGIPMLGVVRGDAAKIITDNKIGLISNYDEVCLRNILFGLTKVDLKEFYKNIRRVKKNWSMSEKIKELVLIIEMVRNE